MANDDFANENIQHAGSYTQSSSDPDVTSHVTQSEDIDRNAHDDLSGTGARVSSAGALSTPTTGNVTIPEPQKPSDLPPKPPDLRKNSQGFGLYNLLKRKMEQRALKIKQGKVKEEQNAA